MNNGRFAIATHILVLLCKNERELLSSDYIASSININPVLVRKEISVLKKAGVVSSKEGKNGGCYLAKKASDINLGFIFKLVFPKSILSLAKNTPNPKCPVGKKINGHLENLYSEAEQAMLQKLSNINLKDFCKKFD
ncbi:Rrf2 family transcriptional regulator [Pelobium manganitolerans]|uniref:Rrf2 family transcriptional regulator n=1 Tax=Pelobium manganitolerans TaxID=1842495 RepID=A0A419S2J0_9SPHI|nr:Rrf2 family transcriptional regulator [Pelobium manganitolerans]RKD13199.1 Rrf2 family transcriptional regulator [Pelobium manganitolerans]